VERGSATDHIHGSKTARVTLVEYADFECPSCRQAYAALKILQAHFGSNLRCVFRHFPQRVAHPHAELAAETAEAAGAQGKFWQMHDLLFEHQQHLDEKHLLKYAKQLELDIPRFENEMRDHVYMQRVQEQVAGAERLHVRATPTFYVNGVFTDVSLGLEHLHQAIDKALSAG
jgi:protein-disulfide isomerase